MSGGDKMSDDLITSIGKEAYEGKVGYQALLKEHYRSAELHVTDCVRREFAHPVNVRKKHYRNVEELREGILKMSRLPDGVYASTYRYLDPMDPTVDQQNPNCDLVFDLDAPVEGDRIEHINEMRILTLRLVNEFLVELGFNLEDMVFEYSGNKGFHIVISTPQYRSLSKNQRSMITKYIDGGQIKKLLEPNKIFPGHRLNKYGWGRQGIHMLSELIDEPARIPMYVTKNADRQKIATLLGNPEVISDLRNGRLNSEFDLSVLTNATFRRAKSLSSPVFDTKPTTDLRRIFRIAGSIHGGSGLPSVRLTYDEMQSTYAIVDKIIEIAGHDSVKVKLSKDTTIDFPTIEEYSAGEHRVPRYVALCLLSQEN